MSAYCAAVRAADVIVVVSGTDGALPSVVAGLVDTPVVSLLPGTCFWGASISSTWTCDGPLPFDPAHCHILVAL